MRLTLRTLLAYMDDVLEPEDREDLKAKIEHSEFAGDLLHRAREVMRRLRLGAPGVADLKKGMDANSVAEYLDNTMSPEQVADFERLCLESEVALAEVASCHQILTMVLGEPADVRAAARARMYDIPAQADLMAMQADDDGAPPAILPRQDVPHVELRSTSQVPDYLRQSFLERHRGKLAVAASVLIAGAAYLFWPPRDVRVPDEVARRGEIEDRTQSPQVDEGDANDDGTLAAPQTATQMTTVGRGQDAQEAAESRAALPTESSAEEEDATILDADDADLIPALPPDVTRGTSIDGDETSTPADVDISSDQPEIRLPDAGRTTTLPEGTLPPEPPLPTVQPSVTDRAANGTAAGAATPSLPSPADATDSTDGGGETSATTAVVEAAEAKPQQVATFTSPGQMLLKRTGDVDWMRLAPLERLLDGDQVLALPASRPVITLQGSNLSVQLQPATRIALDTGGPNLGGALAPAALTVLYGRIVVFNSAQVGDWVALNIRLGEIVYDIDLDGGSQLAIDAQRRLPAGVDPLENSGTFLADLFATTGRVRWQNEGAVQEIEAPAYWHIAGGRVGPVEVLSSEPSWISEYSILPLDGLALPDVERAIVPGRSARLSLAEIADHRKREVRGLVSRASIHVGDFEPFVKSLNDTSQSQLWDEHIAVLQGAMALDKQVAKRVLAAFVNYKGQEAGEELFRLLWGYSKDQLENGALEELIRYLNHESLDFRVLAFNNLHRATGVALMYSPHDQPQQRERFIREWRKRLMENGLVISPEGTGA